MQNKYRDELTSLLQTGFAPAKLMLTEPVEIDPIPESANYSGLTFSLNHKRIVFRQAKITPDRPGAFVTVWQRPYQQPQLTQVASQTDKKQTTLTPIPLFAEQLDYLIIEVQANNHNTHKQSSESVTRGLFVFPAALLIKKGIVRNQNSKGKNGFRVFPPWTESLSCSTANQKNRTFSASGKKTQAWQLPYFIRIEPNGIIDTNKLNQLIPTNLSTE